jgi:hypothetical protein
MLNTNTSGVAQGHLHLHHPERGILNVTGVHMAEFYGPPHFEQLEPESVVVSLSTSMEPRTRPSDSVRSDRTKFTSTGASHHMLGSSIDPEQSMEARTLCYNHPDKFTIA